MRHQNHKRTLGVTVPHRKAMLGNLVVSLTDHNRITTTLARAKETSKLADKMVTLAKKGTLHARRQIIATIRSKDAAKRLIEDIAPLFTERAGGYTRIMKYKKRVGDNAQLVILEFTEFPAIKDAPKKQKKATEPKEDKEDVVVAEKASTKAKFLGSLRRKK